MDDALQPLPSPQGQPAQNGQPAPTVIGLRPLLRPQAPAPTERNTPVNASSQEAEHARPRIDDKAYVSYLLAIARAIKASDLHLRPDDVPWVRVDGKMQPMPHIDKGPTEDAIDGFAREALSEDKYAHMSGARGAGEGRVDGRTTGPVRVQAWRSHNGVNLSMRLLAESVPKLNDLGLPDICKDFPNYRNGLVLFTGETGSGKSTSLAAVIDEILDNWDGNIITFEDPIEYIHAKTKGGKPRKSRCEQVQIGRDMEAYHEGLRSALRSDPDVLMLGEMRDVETINGAIAAAETGHLVFATAHDQRATKTIERLISAFPPGESERIRHQIANVLRAVVSLRLLPRATGKGRVAVGEVLVMNDTIRELIVSSENKIMQIPAALKSLALKEKTQTLEMALAKAVKANLISIATARGETDKTKDLEDELKQLGIR
jgi:twitching motility protein PilT